MSTDERPESLAAQAASWVPPWERQQPLPDRDFQAAATDPDISDELHDSAAAADPSAGDEDDLSAAGLAEDDDDFDESFEGAGPDAGRGAGSDVPPELPPLPGESGGPPELSPLPGESGGPAAVDAPAERPGEAETGPTDVGGEPEVPLPSPVEAAVADTADDELGLAVDAPLPPDGDGTGGVFDAAADDDVSDDTEIDLPFTEVVPGDATDGPTSADGGGSTSADGGGPTSADGGGPTSADGGGSAGADGGGPGGAEGGGSGDAGGPIVAGGAVVSAFAAGQADAEAAFTGGDASAERAKPRSAVPAQGRGTSRPGGAVGAEDGRTGNGVDLDGEPADGAGAGADGGAAPIGDAELRAALEAILLVVDEPVAEMQLAQITVQPTERVAAMLEDISARYTAAGHGFDLRRAAGGWRLYTRPEYAAYVERFVLDGQSVRLTQAALETLAVVAYKQPVTRSRISAIRGVNCDGVMRTLVTRGLIEECGIEGETGAYLYRTTPLFLEKLGLNSVDQLPPLAPFLPDDVEEVLDASG